MTIFWFVIASVLATLSIVLSLITLLTDRDRPRDTTYQRRH